MSEGVRSRGRGRVPLAGSLVDSSTGCASLTELARLQPPPHTWHGISTELWQRGAVQCALRCIEV